MFDENFFVLRGDRLLQRAKSKGFGCYQINSIKVKNEGRSIKIEKDEEKN